MAAPVKDAAWLEWVTSLLGGTSRQACAAKFPPDRFYCLLDELPLHLIPRGTSSFLLEDLKEPLFLNPECKISVADQISDALVSQPNLLSQFALQGLMAWVPNSAAKCHLPFWLGPRLGTAIGMLLPGVQAQSVLGPRDCRILREAGILSSKNSCEQQQLPRALWNTLETQYRDKGYAAFAGLLHPFHVAALRRYYRFLIRKGSIPLGDAQSPRRYVAHNESVARFFHHQLTNMVSVLAGRPVKPSYVYMASYLSGAELKKHTDREQCDFSVSLCLDFSPEPADETSWPLCLETPDGAIKVHQALGDGLFYRGTKLPHYRDRLDEGFTSTSIFFHYVEASFSGSLS